MLAAAREGDSAKVWAWLDDPDAVEPRDVNDRSNTGAGTTLLMAATMFLDAYVRLPREEVLRLRSLVIRGRARPRVRTRAADPIVARVVRLPNELVWKVLAYWRCTSDVTGEVI